MFPLVNCQEAFYKQLVAFIVLIVFVLINDYQDYSLWWQLIPLILLQYLLIIGVGSFFAVFVTFAQDFTMLISMFMMGLMFTSGIFWDVNLIQDPSLKEILMIANPLASIIDGYRQVLMYGNPLNMTYMLSVFAWAASSIVLSMYLLFVFDKALTRRLFV